jgi:hypothetical protein
MNRYDLLCSWIEMVCGENEKCQEVISTTIHLLPAILNYCELKTSRGWRRAAFRPIFEAGSGLSTDVVAEEGSWFRSLTMVAVYTREGVSIEVGQSLEGNDVATLSGSKR